MDRILPWFLIEDASVSNNWVSFHLQEGYHLSRYLLIILMPHGCFLSPPILETFSECGQYLSLVSHNCSLLSRAFKWSLLFNVLLGFCNNNAVIVCIAFKLIDQPNSAVCCAHPFRSLVTFLMYFIRTFPVVNIKTSFL